MIKKKREGDLDVKCASSETERQREIEKGKEKDIYLTTAYNIICPRRYIKGTRLHGHTVGTQRVAGGRK